MNTFAKLPSLLSTDRLCNLIKYSQLAVKGGYFAELGIFQGGSLEVLAKYNPGIDIIGMDSFEGVPEESEFDFHRLGDFNEVNYHKIAGYFGMLYPAVRIVKGFIPKAFDFFDEHVRFSFCHVDLDMYDSVKYACDFLFPRTLTGGIILFDDYNVNSTPGATKAINEFFVDKECKFKGELFYYSNGPSQKQYLVVC